MDYNCVTNYFHSVIDHDDNQFDADICLLDETIEDDISDDDVLPVQTFSGDVPDDDTDSPEYGPHLKFSRREEIVTLKR